MQIDRALMRYYSSKFISSVKVKLPELVGTTNFLTDEILTLFYLSNSEFQDKPKMYSNFNYELA